MGPGADQLSVYANGVVTAILERHVNSKELENLDPILQARVYDFRALYWTHTGSILRLQGEHALDILGPAICVLRGSHRPVWHPRPGMDEVRVVVPLFNPQGLRPIEVFQVAMRLGF